MMRSWKRMVLSLLTVFLCVTLLAFSQTTRAETGELMKSAPRVFIEGAPFDPKPLQAEVPFVNHVAALAEAQVHVLITSQKTEAGDTEYTLAFTGREEFAGVNDTLKHRAKITASQEEIGKGLAKTIKMGLMTYVGKTPVAGRMKITFQEQVKPTAVVDPWKFWVFSLSGNSFMNGEKSFSSKSFGGSFSVGRVTPEMKVRMSVSGDYDKDRFVYGTQTIESTAHSLNFNGLFVKSLNDHWSAGAFLSAESSTFNNVRWSITTAPAVEFNLFPYSQSTKRQLRFLYKVGFGAVRYREETIYNKTSERLWTEELTATFELKEKWGTVSTTLGGSHYFHDFGKNRLLLNGMLSLRIFKGFELMFFGGGSRIRDQLSLVKGSMSLEEVLLRRKQLETSYRYFFSIGLSYTFGSLQSNIVNPRFGTRGLGGISISMR